MWTIIDSPVGQLRIVEQDGAITAIEFEPFRATGRPLGERLDDHPVVPERCAEEARQRRLEVERTQRASRSVLARAVDQLTAYFARDLKEFDLPLAPQGSAFQQQVWDQLRLIGYGETASYGEVARRLGRTNAASRAVGLANGLNPIPIVVPCHRVIGSTGTLTGYAGGLERKRLLLDLEQEALF